MKIFLAGDVMTGRGIDQALPHPCAPPLHEPFMESALGYVRLAERAHGPIARPLDFASLWGEALEELDRVRPHARVVNLETSITRSEAYAPKGINYRMSPENAACLAAAGIDCCVLANNHMLDWGRGGLLDTLSTLRRLHIETAGAGRDLAAARAPAILDIPGEGRLLVYSFACATSGVPRHWAATPDAPGVNMLSDLSEATVADIASRIAEARRPRDIVVASIHWGPNWGHRIAERERAFAHGLIARAGVSIVHGHSAHHAKAIEVYRDRFILYGCGDLLNDYEGIGGYEKFRDDLVLMYFADVDAAGALLALDMAPLQIRRFRLVRAAREDAAWLQRRLDRESRPFGTRIALGRNGRLAAQGSGASGDGIS